jgi:GT2 family glycosyltransferase
MSVRISVIVTCYDLGEFLDEAVSSVLAQTCDDYEILVVDDGSTDPATVALLADYARPKTRVFHTANQGLAAARNAGIARASGTYLCCLDADDRLVPTYFAKGLAAFEADPGLTFVSSWLELFGTEERISAFEHCDLPSLLPGCALHCSSLVRRDAVLAAGGYDPSMVAGCEDWDLWLTLLEAGHRGTVLKEPLFQYRRRERSMSQLCTAGRTHLDIWRYVAEKHRESYQRYPEAVLLHQEVELARVTDQCLAAEQRLAALRPQIDQRREELARLQQRLQAPVSPVPGPTLDSLAVALQRIERELNLARDQRTAIAESLERHDRAELGLPTRR